MFGSLKVLCPTRRILCWGSWLAALALGGLALAGTTSFTAHARLSAEGRTTTAWVAYQPWTLQAGRSMGQDGKEVPPGVPNGWCTRATIQGATPWGTWDAAVLTCLPPLRFRRAPIPTRAGNDRYRLEP